MAFDLLNLNGHDLRDRAPEERREILASMLVPMLRGVSKFSHQTRTASARIVRETPEEGVLSSLVRRSTKFQVAFATPGSYVISRTLEHDLTVANGQHALCIVEHVLRFCRQHVAATQNSDKPGWWSRPNIAAARHPCWDEIWSTGPNRQAVCEQPSRLEALCASAHAIEAFK